MRTIHRLTREGKDIKNWPCTLNEMNQEIRRADWVIEERYLKRDDNNYFYAFKEDGRWITLDDEAIRFANSRAYQDSPHLN